MWKVSAESRRKHKHYIRLTNDLNIKLKRLAVSCNLRPAELSYLCLDCVLTKEHLAKEFLKFIRSEKDSRGARVAFHYLRLDDELENQLQEIVQTMRMPAATFQYHVLNFCLNSSFVHAIQNEMNTNDNYRVMLHLQNGKITYL